MFELARFSQNNMLQLPTGIAKNFNVSDRFIVCMEGEILYLKRIRTSPFKIVEQAPEGEPIIRCGIAEKVTYTVSTLVFYGMIFDRQSDRSKSSVSGLKNPSDRLKRHVPEYKQFLYQKKTKLKHYT